jgi:NAD(P)-dependent dehydrogenase (short-subunit alcohol dehydrogenase family)
MHDKKVALVTGASSGLGFAIAQQLAENNISVLLAARTLAKATAAADKLRAASPNADVTPIQLDVANASDIAALAPAIEKRFGRLDILVNNAGVELEHTGATTAQQLRDTFETNTIAPYSIARALLPLLKRSPAGRIVNHSSILGSIETQSRGNVGSWGSKYAYNASKAALNMITVVMANELKGTKIKVNAAHPGWVQTALGGDNAPLSPAEGAKTAVALALLPDDGPTGAYMHDGKRIPW